MNATTDMQSASLQGEFLSLGGVIHDAGNHTLEALNCQGCSGCDNSGCSGCSGNGCSEEEETEEDKLDP